jgi:hypothetical protein
MLIRFTNESIKQYCEEPEMNEKNRVLVVKDEPTWRCQENPFIRALGIQEPVIPGEPSIEGLPVTSRTLL